jgi:hypothetical protein
MLRKKYASANITNDGRKGFQQILFSLDFHVKFYFRKKQQILWCRVLLNRILETKTFIVFWAFLEVRDYQETGGNKEY